MDTSAASRYYHSRRSEQYLITFVFLAFLFTPACLSEKTLIPPKKLSAIDISDPKVADGFGYPILECNSAIMTKFLKSERGCFGCPPLYHPGVDLRGTRGTAVFAIANGIVVFADFQDVFTGYVVVISHIAPSGIAFRLPGGGETSRVWSAYLHLSGIEGRTVALNAVIVRGARIGFIGDCPHGSQEDYHLHFEIRKQNTWNGAACDEDFNIVWMRPKDYVSSKFVDPLKFIRLNHPLKTSRQRG